MSHHHGNTAEPICPKFCKQMHLDPEWVYIFFIDFIDFPPFFCGYWMILISHLFLEWRGLGNGMGSGREVRGGDGSGVEWRGGLGGRKGVAKLSFNFFLNPGLSWVIQGGNI